MKKMTANAKWHLQQNLRPWRRKLESEVDGRIKCQSLPFARRLKEDAQLLVKAYTIYIYMSLFFLNRVYEIAA